MSFENDELTREFLIKANLERRKAFQIDADNLNDTDNEQLENFDIVPTSKHSSKLYNWWANEVRILKNYQSDEQVATTTKQIETMSRNCIKSSGSATNFDFEQLFNLLLSLSPDLLYYEKISSSLYAINSFLKTYATEKNEDLAVQKLLVTILDNYQI